MPENNGSSPESKATQALEFQEFVKRQFELLFARVDKLESNMNERFLQLSRQIRNFDIKVDVYTREHSYM